MPSLRARRGVQSRKCIVLSSPALIVPERRLEEKKVPFLSTGTHSRRWGTVGHLEEGEGRQKKLHKGGKREMRKKEG